MEVGGLKDKLKLVFWYEYLLRITNKGKKVYVIPKVGYEHHIGRKGSIVAKAREEISDKEAQWLFNLARKDYFFKDTKDEEYYEFKNESLTD